MIGAGLLLTAIADGVYLFLTAAGTYSEGTMLDALWPAAMLTLAWAGLEAPASRGQARARGRADARDARSSAGWSRSGSSSPTTSTA